MRHEGNDVSVEFQDDGAGLNIARIREKAIEQGLITPQQQLDADAANLIFLPGFSTAAGDRTRRPRHRHGRGPAEVNALGGRIETTTQPGRGTSFKLVLPLTTAVTQVVMVRSGKLAIGVPANLVELVRRASQKASRPTTAAASSLPASSCPSSGRVRCCSPPRSQEPQGKTLPVVIFRSAAQRVAVHVDEVLGNQEVVVKNLGPQMARLPGLAGMTVLASGAVVLIYNPVALAQVYGEQARAMSADQAQPEMLEQAGRPAAPAAPAVPTVPLVLVVDDSITVRRVTQRLLMREGYRVALAADGLQALERLAEELPTVVLDIEMPRMDGFDLARNIRGDTRLAHLPIVMITRVSPRSTREHAKELGVNHYLGKPYSEEELLNLVKHYCTQAVSLKTLPPAGGSSVSSAARSQPPNGGCFVAGLQEGQQRRVRIRRAAHHLVGQDELAHLRAVDGAGRLHSVRAKPGGLRIGIAIEGGIGMAPPPARSRVAHLVRVGLARDPVRQHRDAAGVGGRRGAAGNRVTARSMEPWRKVHRAALADKTRAEDAHGGRLAAARARRCAASAS